MQPSDDVRGMYDRLYLGVWDLQGRDVTVTIAKVLPGELKSNGRRAEKKPIVHFEKTEKAFPLNKTNMKTIGAMYGFKAKDWVGKRITLYPTQTSFGSEQVDAIRVRPGIPKAKGTGIASQAVDPAMREKQDRAAGRERDVDPEVAAQAIADSLEMEDPDHGA